MVSPHVVVVNLINLIFLLLLPSNRVISESEITRLCSSSSQLPQIRLPFRLNRQYPSGGFNLLCNYSTGEKQNENDVILQLPAGSGDFIVRSISYSSKEVEITDPLFCLPGKLLQFNVDALVKKTPYYGDYHYSFSLYNCSSSMTRRLSSSSCKKYGVIDCLSGDDYRVIVISSSDMMKMRSYSLVGHCDLIGNLSFTTTRAHLTPYRFSRQRSLYLKWVDPAPATHEYRQLQEKQGDDPMQSQMNYDPYYSPPPPDSSNSTKVVAATVLAILIPILMIFLSVCVYRSCVQSAQHTGNNPTAINSSHQRATSPTTELTPGLDQSVIDTFPTMIIQGEDKWLTCLDDKACSICLSNYELHDVLKILPGCLHKFHGECVDEWIRSNGICPICRTELPKR